MPFPRTGSFRLRATVAAFLLAASIARADGGTATTSLPVERMRKAVVAVRATQQETDWKNPWKKLSPRTVEFNGIVAEGHTILVPGSELNAYTLIEVQRLGEQDWRPAKVKLVDWELPLALLEVDDPSFWNGLEPLTLASVVPTTGEVQLAKWESGKFEVANATVARLESDVFGFGRVRALALRLTTTSTSSVHGEAVIAGGQIVGMVSNSAKDDLTAFASPFLGDFRREAAHTPYRGFGRLGAYWQTLTNPSLRESLGLHPEDGGVLVLRVVPEGSAVKGLLPRDIVLEVDGHHVDASGRFEHPKYGPMRWSLLFTEGKHAGEVVNVLVIRNHSRQTVAVLLRRSSAQDDRVPQNLVGEKPDYAIEGGLVFQHLSLPYLATFQGARSAPPLRLAIAASLDGEWPTPEHPKVVVLTIVLPDPANLGYQELHDLIVERVNGVSVRNLADLRVAFTKPVGPNHVLEFLAGQGVRRIVLDAAEVEAAAQRVKLD